MSTTRDDKSSRSALSFTLISALSLAILSCQEPEPPALQITISECLNLSGSQEDICGRRLNSIFGQVSEPVGCFITSQREQVVNAVEVYWREGQPSFDAQELSFDSSVAAEAHLIFLDYNSPYAEPRLNGLPVDCDGLSELNMSFTCNQIPGCVMKLDGGASSNERVIGFLDDAGRCKGSFTEVYFVGESVTPDQLGGLCLGPSIKEPCTVGEGLCQNSGELVQSVTGLMECDVSPFPPGPNELCGTGLDEDCDGFTDEGFVNFGQPCELMDAQGNSVEGIQDCSFDRLGLECKVGDNDCDGQDNDADGRVDEGYITVAIDCPPGSCSESGFMRCVNGQRFETCESPGPEAMSQAELCDGFDNDCDGSVDESIPVRELTCGLGVCLRSGVEVCSNGSLVEVCDAGVPAVEACNEPGTVALDEDCDGAVNEDLSTIDCPICPPDVTPTMELCDNADNDCDGSVDEGVLNACGQCGDVPEEVCDGRDNDCDSSADEGLLNACNACGPAPDEICDGLDNDCDGSVDEGDAGPNACGECAPLPEEVCDGVDNDCDGRTDENPVDPAPLAMLQFGVCSTQRQVCLNGGWAEPDYTLIPNYNSVDSSCDGRDNDCDGSPDEDYNAPPATNQVGVCQGQLKSCVNGVEVEPTLGSEDTQELCQDELDNDCDGQIDQDDSDCEGFCNPNILDYCNGLDDDCDGSIDEDHDGNSDEQPTPPAEECDTIDNDCDGEIDETSTCFDQLRNLYEVNIHWSRGTTELQTVVLSASSGTQSFFIPDLNQTYTANEGQYRPQSGDTMSASIVRRPSVLNDPWVQWMESKSCSFVFAWIDNFDRIGEGDCVGSDESKKCIQVSFGLNTMSISKDLEDNVDKYAVGVTCNLVDSNGQSNQVDQDRFEYLRQHLSFNLARLDDSQEELEENGDTVCVLPQNPPAPTSIELNNWRQNDHRYYLNKINSVGSECELVFFSLGERQQ